IVLAAAGASLDETAREARGALDAKRGQLSEETSAVQPLPPLTPTDGPDEVSAEVALVNPHGLHSRPAATIVKTVAGFEAAVTIANVTSGKGPVAGNSLIGIMSLGAVAGDVMRFSATGAHAAAAVSALTAMAADGFGELS
ncbi:MAG: HPr family phosphocarrier protein, partial [Rhodoglobus sp.]|nr:HPr family phosphocarrier protein [Rhodoglobus sp.]